MEGINEISAGKAVMRIFAIVFSIVLVPALFFLIPTGGMVVTAADMVSKESIEKSISEAEIGKELYEACIQEVMASGSIDDLRDDVVEGLLRNVIKQEDVESILQMFVDAVYTGEGADVDFSDITDRAVNSLNKIYEDGIDELYASWKNGKASSVFSESFGGEFMDEVERHMLEEFSEYSALNLDELEAKYDEAYGAGAFGRLLDDKVEEFQDEFVTEFKEPLTDAMAEMMKDAEYEVEKAADDMVNDDDVREVFDLFGTFSARSKMIKVVVYAIVFGIVLFLLIFYLFDVPGFVVTAIPLLLGGGVCKALGLAEKEIMSFFNKEIFPPVENDNIGEQLAHTLVEKFVHPAFEKMGNFGMTMIIAGVILIGCAIMRNLLKKNKQAVEESYR